MENNKARQKSWLKLDVFLWSICIFLLVASVFANHFFQNIAFAIRLAILIVLFIIVLFIFLQTTTGKKLWNFAKGAKVELNKVVWPKRQEVIHVTFIVVGLVVLVAVLLWGVDLLLWLVKWFTQ